MRGFVVLVCGMALLAAAPAQAAPRKYGQRVSDCKSWDCQGGIICSCCFDNGCWICDAWPGTGKPKNDQGDKYCHWEDKAIKGINPKLQPQGELEQVPSQQPAPPKPGGGTIQK